MSVSTDGPFRFHARALARPGCGYGINQSHLVGTFGWQPGQTTRLELEVFAKTLQSLIRDESVAFAGQHSVEAVAEWVARALGALLRAAGIATVRDFHVSSLRQAAEVEHLCTVVLPFESLSATSRALTWLLSNMNTPVAKVGDLETKFESLVESLKPLATSGANPWRLRQAAHDERYPVVMVAPDVVCIGSGESRRWFFSFISDKTPALAMRVAQDKFQTARLLRSQGFPGAHNQLVGSPEEAVAAAKAMGYPLVVKPNDKDRGEGVSADIVSEPDLLRAYEIACAASSRVLVEKFQPGFTHRITVVEGTIVRVAKHMAFGVTGDGVSTIEQLVLARAQTLEERLRAARTPTAACRLDDEATALLKQTGRSASDVPLPGEYVKLRRRDNISAGGQRITLDPTKDVHPDNTRLALDVCRLLRLDFAGVDLITDDIGRSWRDRAATICEINGNPQLVARDDPDMYKKVLRQVIPGRGRVPLDLVVLADSPDDQQAQQLTDRFSPTGTRRGLSMASGTWVGRQRLGQAFPDGFAAARALATGADAQALTFVLTVAEVLRHGLPLGEIDHLFLPWGEPGRIPADQADAATQLMLMVQPHAKKVSAL